MKKAFFTDKSASYIDIANYIEIHVNENSNNETTTETLNWVNFVISNYKINFLGNYRKIKEKYIQSYFK